MSAQDLKKVSSGENIALLDVRERVEFDAFAIEGAVNLPLTELLEAARNGSLKALIERKIPANAQKIVIYCTGYTRTVEAAREIAPLEDALCTCLRAEFLPGLRSKTPLFRMN